ncbi:hypothetical protein BC835DRAFT_496871 [Cytidiella melzeri]|nr:hypothetical protein BC835DRAFT_496871 [Cytidiella melzeri]
MLIHAACSCSRLGKYATAHPLAPDLGPLLYCLHRPLEQKVLPNEPLLSATALGVDTRCWIFCPVGTINANIDGISGAVARSSTLRTRIETSTSSDALNESLAMTDRQTWITDDTAGTWLPTCVARLSRLLKLVNMRNKRGQGRL